MAETYDRTTPILLDPRSGNSYQHREEDLPAWDLFVARSGEEGARWVAEYFDSGWDDLRLRVVEAVTLLRRQRIEAARERLQGAQEGMQKLDPAYPDRTAVLRRFFLAANAYYHYMIGDYEGATENANGAHEAVEEAIRHQPLLLPLAHHCIEFQFLHTRIARAQRHWDAVRQCIDRILATANDRRPLCHYDGGQPLYLSALYDYLLTLPLLTDEEREGFKQLVERQARRETWDLLVRQVYALPGLVIPYP